jgi:putative aldouronate transport system substrate-binding protein
VEAAVNEITIPAKNIEVEFRPISLADSFSNYSLWISSGESVDLMCLLAQDIRQYVTSGQLEPLDGYIGDDKTPTLSKLMREFNITGVVQGQIYGLSSVFPNYGTQPGMIVRKEWLDETGFPKKDIYTMEDVTAVFASIKANHPDCYPFTPLINGLSNGATAIATFTDVAVVGDHAAAGALMDKDSETVVNLFETEEYREYLALLSEWYEAGYIMPDAATTDLSGGELLKNGRVAAFANEMAPQQFGAEAYGFELAGLPTDEPFISGVGGIYFGVPITARHPEAAVRFWDCQLENHDLLNLILRGIQGEHWVMANEAEGFIDYPEGMDATNTPYLNLFGVWGDRRYEYNFNHDITREATSAYTEAAMKNKWKSYGFSFDNTPITNELLSCQSVLDQYQKALETGVLGKNWEDTYDRMRAELQTAGTNATIAECQRQLDEFLGK